MPFKVLKLSVKNFRNLTSDPFEFSPKITCIFGENGNGKTNVLEAVHVLANRKSFHKKTSFPQFISIDGEELEIHFSSLLEDDEGEHHSYSGKMYPKSGEWYFDGRPCKKRPDIHTAFINPFDSFHFHNQASFRRQWVDQHLSQLDREYKAALSRYHKFLRQRNALLSKKPPHYAAQVDALDKELCGPMVTLVNKRLKYLEDLRPYLSQAFQNIFSEQHELELTLDSDFIGKNEEHVLNVLQQQREKDEILGHTSKGAHKDDYVLLFDGLNSYDYCSLGQQKMSYLSLLFAYIELFRYKFKAFPIVLMDDVSGELDRVRWRRLVQFLEKCSFQILITTANEEFKEELENIPHTTRIFVTAGNFRYL